MILEVHFVPVDAPSTSRPQRSPPGDDDSTDPPDEDEASDQADSGEDARDASSSLTEGARSRSPRQEGPRGPPPPRPVNRSAGRYVNTAGRANMWTPFAVNTPIARAYGAPPLYSLWSFCAVSP